MKNQAHSKNESQELSKPKDKLDKCKTSHTLTEEASSPKDIILTLPTAAKEEAQEEAARTSVEDSSVDESSETTLNSVSEEVPLSSTVEDTTESATAKQTWHSSINTDSDEERLIIVDPGTPLSGVANKKQTVIQEASENATDSNTSSVSHMNVVLSSSSSIIGAKKGIKRPRVSADCDQLGHILQMQNAMLKSTTTKSQEAPKAPTAECRPPEAKPSSHPVSLVKPSVSSYLELEYREGLKNEAAAPATSQPSAQRKS